MDRTRLLDFSSSFDVAALDDVVRVMHDPHRRASERTSANDIMVSLQHHPESWTKVCEILEHAAMAATRFFGLQILEDAVKYRWKTLPLDQREGIKVYLVQKVLDMSSQEDVLRVEKTFIHKMDLVLVQVLKHEWPHHWPSFIADIVASSKTSEVLCENNLTILKLLSEEIFDFSKNEMTMDKVKHLKLNLNKEFTQIFQLCQFVLEKSTRVSLITICLQTLLRFLTWIPFGFIFETDLIGLLTTKFFPVPAFRSDTLACLTEIVILKDTDLRYNGVFQTLYVNVLNQLAKMIAPGTSFTPVLHQDEVFVQRLALFFTGFFRHRIELVEQAVSTGGAEDEVYQHLVCGFTYLVNISEVDEDGIFKICLDYWHYFTKSLYAGEPPRSSSASMAAVLNLGLSNNKNDNNNPHPRKSMYSAILSRVRLVMISQMVKPSEVLIVEDENGEIVRETTKDTEALSQYKTMHDTLIYLTHLDYEDTENIMLEKLAFQVDGSEWSWTNLNTLCWAIGSISGAMSEEDEKRFLVTVIKDLLGLCEMKRGKDNKAVVASNIMYVVGQYPRFLRAHWKFLKTVVNKLFEFMHELHPGVQDMACDTFLKIAQKCKRKFTTVQVGEACAFVEDLLLQLPSIVSDLLPHQVTAFYEAVATMLSAETTNGTRRTELVSKLMALPNACWLNIMSGASTQGVSVLTDVVTMKELGKILKTNWSVCQAIGQEGYLGQMQQLFNDVIQVHKAYSAEIVLRVQSLGEVAIRTSDVRTMRSLKKDILHLFQAFIEHGRGSGGSSSDMSSQQVQPSPHASLITHQFLPQLLNHVLTDYHTSVPAARDAEILTLMAVCLDRLPKVDMLPHVPAILSGTLDVTLDMITRNFEDFPEHRMAFFHLLQAVNFRCFESLFVSISVETQKLVVDSIVWALKHTERPMAERGLETLTQLLVNVQRTPEIAQDFYARYYLLLVQDVLAVLTDGLHKSGLKQHAMILHHLFHVAGRHEITVSLVGGISDPGLDANNQLPLEFLQNHVQQLIASSFQNLNAMQVSSFVRGCFDLHLDLTQFKNHLRDFLVQIKEFGGAEDQDHQELFYEEQMAQAQAEAEKIKLAQRAVPGLVQPNDQMDDLDDL